jgi:hypothetical protein
MMTKIIERKQTAEEKAEQEAYAAGEYDRAVELVNEQRRSAYQIESDPIYFQAQRGDTYTLDDWKAKVAEIDERFPYPVKGK